ncbi:DUF3016 domain-containing protein [Pseudoduganella eburnea]|uniref:DUF3016 domain-containing protein n=1 Tax=Massilia eburnea TaxID=1776165 RepID=A0A6L6QAN6_9BURK|nr:DUF3016 domain-containing protein [Massilia eburnea]MTW09482.1 DUF3016 domain-containing protein [Massilia eburnea]
MKHATRFCIAAALLLAAAAAASAGTVTVKYQEPEKFMDVPAWESDRAEMLKEFTEHFQRLAQRLPANQQLNITVTDIDLAGRVEPRRRHFVDDVRILRGGADWPTMSLNYTLEQDGKVIASGEEHLKNMMYLERFNHYASGDTLRYEKPMIDDWFKATFVAPTQLSKK